MRTTPYAVVLTILVTSTSQAGLQDWLNKLPSSGNASPQTTGSVAALSSNETVAALKEALNKGTAVAVQQLGREGGYLNNPQVRIPMPEKLEWVEKTLRSLGQDAVADEFIGTLNRAAEQAVPVALEQFQSAISKMTLEDAKGILTGPNDAATQYFRRQSEDTLRTQFLPIVRKTTEQAGATSAYKNMLGKVTFMGNPVSTQSLDIDQYVTNKALDGLFLLVAAEEQRIRENPLARSSELLKKVFGSVSQ